MFNSEYISSPDNAAEHADLKRLLSGLEKAYDLFLKESSAAFETAYDNFLDDDLAEELQALDDEEDEEIDEPACGDCGACCECLGDPPEYRWDTTSEMDDEFKEIYGS